MPGSYDAIVIGAGHNGLVCACELARAGWSVLVLERNEEVGGALRSGEATQPGLVHDLYATNLNLFLGSPFFAEHGESLGRLGFEPVTCSAPFVNVFDGGRSLGVWQDAERTLAQLRAHDVGDAEGWQELGEVFGSFAEHVLPLYGLPLPSGRAAVALARATRKTGIDGALGLLRVLVQSTADLGDRYFSSREAKALIATWGMHLDFPPSMPGGAMFPLLECFADQQFGISIAKGGASCLADAMAALAREQGVEVRCGADVQRVVVGPDGAEAVELAGGERIAARRAVVANLAPDVLFGEGAPGDARGPRRARRARAGGARPARDGAPRAGRSAALGGGRGDRPTSRTCTSARTARTCSAPTTPRAPACCPTSRRSSSARRAPSTPRARPTGGRSCGSRRAWCPPRSAATRAARSPPPTGPRRRSRSPTASWPSSSATRRGSPARCWRGHVATPDDLAALQPEPARRRPAGRQPPPRPEPRLPPVPRLVALSHARRAAAHVRRLDLAGCRPQRALGLELRARPDRRRHAAGAGAAPRRGAAPAPARLDAAR